MPLFPFTFRPENTPSSCNATATQTTPCQKKYIYRGFRVIGFCSGLIWGLVWGHLRTNVKLQSDTHAGQLDVEVLENTWHGHRRHVVTALVSEALSVGPDV